MPSTQGTALYKHVHGAVRSVDRSKRQIIGVASRYEVDRDKAVVIPRGIQYDMSGRQDRPKFIKDHDRTKLMGRLDDLWLGTVPDKDGGMAEALLFKATFKPPGTDREADDVYAEIERGERDAFSIGFLEVETDPAPVLPGQRGPTYKRIDLLEVSTVPFPSCRGCVVLEKTAGSGGGSEVIELPDLRDYAREVHRQRMPHGHQASHGPNGYRYESLALTRFGPNDIVLTLADTPSPVRQTQETFDVDDAFLRQLCMEIVAEARRGIIGALDPLVRDRLQVQINKLRGRVD